MVQSTLTSQEMFERIMNNCPCNSLQEVERKMIKDFLEQKLRVAPIWVTSDPCRILLHVDENAVNIIQFILELNFHNGHWRKLRRVLRRKKVVEDDTFGEHYPLDANGDDTSQLFSQYKRVYRIGEPLR